MDARSLAKSLHPLEVKVLLGYGPGDRLDSRRLEAELGYKEGHSNQAFSWLSAKGLAAEDGRESRTVYELTPLGREFALKGTPEERMLRFLSDKGPARLPEIASSLGLEQKDVGSAFGILSKEGALSMDGDKRAVIAQGWSQAASVPKPRVAVVRDLIARAAASSDGILEESELDAAERAAIGGIARKRGSGDAAFRAAERERVWYRLSPGASEVADELKSQGVTGDELGAVTPEILEKGSWKDAAFRPYNINVPAARLTPGRRNAYVEFLEGVKDKLVSLGFEEFDGGLVETEFWNSDALFMPQFHSARDIHDVYHLAEPAKAKSIEEPYLSAVAATHENGGSSGSRGWDYAFDREFTKRLILRSQGTVLSARQLPKAKVPGKLLRHRALLPLRQGRRDPSLGLLPDRGHSPRRGGESPDPPRLPRDVRGRGGRRQGGEVRPGLLSLHRAIGRGAHQASGARLVRARRLGHLPARGHRAPGNQGARAAWGIGIDRMALMALGLNDLRELFSPDIESVRLRRAKFN